MVGDEVDCDSWRVKKQQRDAESSSCAMFLTFVGMALASQCLFNGQYNVV